MDVVLSCGLFQPLFGYLDPGTITFVMQCFVAVVVGMTVSCRVYWTVIKTRVSNMFSRNAVKNSEEVVAGKITAVDSQSVSDDQRKAA